VSVETGIPMSVLLDEPEDYLRAMMVCLANNRRSPFERKKVKTTNAEALSELDKLL
jgi:hypothetical protein